MSRVTVIDRFRPVMGYFSGHDQRLCQPSERPGENHCDLYFPLGFNIINYPIW